MQRRMRESATSPEERGATTWLSEAQLQRLSELADARGDGAVSVEELIVRFGLPASGVSGASRGVLAGRGVEGVSAGAAASSVFGSSLDLGGSEAELGYDWRRHFSRHVEIEARRRGVTLR